MAGVKDKSGLKKGQTNNPAGRPVGSRNKKQNPVKNLFEDFSTDKFDKFKEDYESITDPYQRAKLYLDVAKTLVPRPINEEEKEPGAIRSEFMKRLFGEQGND